MKRIRFFFVAIAILTAVVSCSFSTPTMGGPVVKETRDVSGFTAISLSVPANVYVEQGSGFSFVIEGSQSALKEIETVVEGSAVRIKWRNKFYSWRGSEEIKIFVTVPTLSALSIAGSGGIYVKAGLTVENLTMSIAGSGDVVIESIDATGVKCSIAGSGDIKLNAGKVTTLSASISGSGSIKASNLEASGVKVGIAGSGDCFVWATGSLDASISGSGDIKYKGTPKLVAKVSGSGDIKPVN